MYKGRQESFVSSVFSGTPNPGYDNSSCPVSLILIHTTAVKNRSSQLHDNIGTVSYIRTGMYMYIYCKYL